MGMSSQTIWSGSPPDMPDEPDIKPQEPGTTPTTPLGADQSTPASQDTDDGPHRTPTTRTATTPTEEARFRRGRAGRARPLSTAARPRAAGPRADFERQAQPSRRLFAARVREMPDVASNGCPPLSGGAPRPSSS